MMKKYFLILCVAIIPMISFTSCSDDDDVTINPDSVAAKAAGTYQMSIGGSACQAIVTAKTDNSIQLQLKDVAISGSITLPSTITTPTIELVESVTSGGSTFTSEQKIEVAMEGGSKQTVTLIITGVIYENGAVMHTEISIPEMQIFAEGGGENPSKFE